MTTFRAVADHKPVAEICIASWAHEAEVFAAGRLQSCFEQMTSAHLPIQQRLTDGDTPRYVIADLSSDATRKLLPADLAEPLQHDGYRITRRGDTIYIVSREAGGVVHGVFQYLARCCGCRFCDLPPRGQLLPRLASVEHDAIDIIDNPACWYRTLQVNAAEEPRELLLRRLDWMAQNGYSHVLIHYGKLKGLLSTDAQTEWGSYRAWLFPALRERGLKFTLGHHNFSYLVPHERYLADRPDFFALVDGKRQPAGQLQFCLSNPDLINTLSRQLIAVVSANPGIDTVALWPDDGVGELCQCDNCKKLDSPADQQDTRWDWLYGANDAAGRNVGRRGQRARSRRYLHVCNQVARRLAEVYPRIRLSAIAYVDFVDPPLRDIEIHPNIVVHLAVYWRCSQHRLSDANCPLNRQYVDIINDWLKVIPAERLLVTTYEAGMGCWKSLPFPIADLLHDDWKWLKSLGIGGVKSNAFSSHWGVYNLNYVMLARALRQAHPDRDAVLDEFCAGLFGKAAAPVREMLELWERRMRNADAQCVTPSPLDYLGAIFDPATMTRSRELCANAESLAGDDERARWYVARLGALLEYTRINLDAPAAPLLDFLRGRGANRDASPDVEAWLERDGSFVRRHQTGEWDLFPRNFAEGMRRRWLMQI